MNSSLRVSISQVRWMRGFAVLGLVLAAAGGVAQTGGGATGTKSAPTLHATARLVVVDVMVTDGHGDPVKGLKPSDFHLTERKSPQTIRSFEEHAGAPSGSVVSAPKLQPGVFTNVLSTPAGSAVTVVLLDMINTPMQDQSFVRGQLLRYLREAKPGTRIAIFALTSRLVMLQGFTTDLEMLRRAVEQTSARPPPLLGGKAIGKADRVEDLTRDINAQLMASSETPAAMLAALTEFDSTEKGIDQSLNAGNTLRGLNQLARYLAGVPGRKNLIWFSASFPLSVLPHGPAGSDPFAGQPSWEAEYRETVDLLARSRVAVYPIDARALMTSPTLQASNTTPGGSRGVLRSETAFSNTVFETQSTMFEMAEDTGGKAFVNTNGLAQAVEQVVDSGSNYYTLTYTPTDADAHGEYRSIRVEVAGQGYKLAYRRGYYASRGDTNERQTAENGSGGAGGDAIQLAKAYTAPVATQILFYARVLPMPLKEASAEGGVSGRTELAKNGTVAYNVEYSIEPQSLSIETSPDGLRHGHLEFVAVVYDSNGRVVNSDVKPVRVTWSSAQLDAAMQHGLRYQQEVRAPAKEGYSLRVLVHDLQSGKIGAVDVAGSELNSEAFSGVSSAQPR